MKKLIAIPLMIISLMTFGQDSKKYDYLSITHVGQEVRITQNDDEFRVEKFDKKLAGNGDYRPVFHWIKKYEEDGWTLYDIELTQYMLIAILRKERND